MTLACGYIYCCAGFCYQNTDELTKSCERFSLLDQTWESIPDLPTPKVAPTVVAVDKIWIYSFGDSKNTIYEDSDHILEINKINT